MGEIMKIYGLQKMTLLDYPGHVACTIFLSGCDFRCPFCHNFDLASGKLEPVMEEEELLAFLEKRRGLLDGAAITGGEPCLSPGLPSLLQKIRSMGFSVKLDTNGFHPMRLKEIIEAGLVDYVAMDIKNSPGKYALTTGTAVHDPVSFLTPLNESISLLMQSSVDYEFRTTVVAQFHEEEDFHQIGQMIRGARRHFLQKFTDRDTVPFEGLSAPSDNSMRRYLDIMASYVDEAGLRGVD